MTEVGAYTAAIEILHTPEDYLRVRWTMYRGTEVAGDRRETRTMYAPASFLKTLDPRSPR